MLKIGRRWPVLTALGAALIYTVNNYQISGFEHLHFEPIRRPLATKGGPPGDASYPENWGGGASFDFTQFGIQTSAPIDPSQAGWGSSEAEWLGSGSGGTAASGLSGLASRAEPAWSELLNAGEKLALFQEKLAAPQAGSPSGATELASSNLLPLPSTTPIPAPLELYAGLSSGLAGGRGPTGRNGGVGGFPANSGLAQSPFPLPSTINPQHHAKGSTIAPFAPTDSQPPAARMTSLSPPLEGLAAEVPRPPGGSPAIRIASFHIPALGPAALGKPQVAAALVDILRQYELVALQGIQSERDDLLPMLLERLNQAGAQYDYIVGPRVGREPPHEQFAFVFDTQHLETDRYQLYTVDDPEDLITREPLVGWFRCRGVPAESAFTFSLINLSIEPRFGDAERNLLTNLIDAIEGDGRQEDDWILAGDFAGGREQLGSLQARGVRHAIGDMPTDVAGTRSLDNLIFSTRATSEYLGRAGAFDFLRKYNFSLEQAQQISSHMPVWAEFSKIEGAEPGRVAPTPQPLQ